MKNFSDLYLALDQTNKTNEKVEAIVKYFQTADAADAAWAIYFLSGRKPRQIIKTAKLREWAAEISEVPDWLFEVSYDAVGDLAETIALLLPDTNAEGSNLPLAFWVENRTMPLREMTEDDQREAVVQAWNELDANERFIWNKLVTGSFRVGVSQSLVVRALAQVSGIEKEIIAHRLMGTWSPNTDFYLNLLEASAEDADLSRPFPFHLAHQLDFPLEELGEISDWQAEWKWDGIRAQLIRRGGESFLWSRGEDLVSERFPEITEASFSLPDGTVLDGEILPWKDSKVLPFAQLQRRIGRKTIGKKLLEEVPVVLLCYDLLELGGEDFRQKELQIRRAELIKILEKLPGEAQKTLQFSPVVKAASWEELTKIRDESRSRKVEGFMLKRLASPFRVGRPRGDWWKWKIEPLTVDAVMIYARGTGKRASLYTDYTFAVWNNGELVPFAKAYSGLTDKEIRRVDRFVRDNTIETFGPVRSVKAKLVFELGFEGIQKSSRHKSGVAVRFPRILRWRDDKKIEDADTLDAIHRMLEAEN
ncbi:MAG: ATP-dependent DNA ligase [Acidobacteria bacterium]|jgi:DNA ligase-1|nr:ATP-dependent DNA ligase [Acidobacteriota bacterium]